MRQECPYILRLPALYNQSNWIIFNELFTFSNLKRHLFSSPIKDQGKQISDITFLTWVRTTMFLEKSCKNFILK